jgi:hypothetical protein
VKNPALSHATTNSRDKHEAQLAAAWKNRESGLFIADPTRLNEHSYNVAYSAGQWPLSFGQNKPYSLIFEARITKLGKPARNDKPVPEKWRPAFRRFAWLLINEPLPDEWALIGRSAVDRPGAVSIHSAFVGLRQFIEWLTARPGREDISEFRDITGGHLTDYVRHLQRKKITSGKKTGHLTGLSYLWAYGAAGHLPADDTLPKPVWLESQTNLFGGSDRGEGVAPLEQSTIDPAVTWAQEFVDCFADDCCNALDWYQSEYERVMARVPRQRRYLPPGTEEAVAVIQSMTSLPQDFKPGRVSLAHIIAAHPSLAARDLKAAIARLRKRGELPPLAPFDPAKPKPKAIPVDKPVPPASLISGPVWSIDADAQAAVALIRSMEMLPRDAANAGIAIQYIAAINPPLTVQTVAAAVRRLKRRGELPPLAPKGTPMPIPVPVNAKINGEPWTEFDWRDVSVPAEPQSPIRSVLQGASTILIGYFGAGPRPLELRSLKKGCMRVEDRGNGSIRWHIIGRISKGERDENGHKDHIGREHLWPSLPQAARAVELMERLTSNQPDVDLLFTFLDGTPLSRGAMQVTIDDFVSKANGLAMAHNLPARRHIHHDADRIVVSRLRRTIDTHIYNRPDGPFDLAVVNGHRGMETGPIYGGLKQSGHQGHISPALAETVARTLNTLGTVLDAGGGVSGPAAKDVIDAATTYKGSMATTFKGSIESSRDMKRALNDPNIRAFDNPDGAIGCKPRPGYPMPCQNDELEDRKTEPDQTNCKSECGNRYRTDTHAKTLEARAEAAEQLILQELQDEGLADLAPGPEAARLRARAESWRRQAQEHWDTRIGKDGALLAQVERDTRI